MGETTSYFQSIMALSACMVHLLYECVVPVYNFDFIHGTALMKHFKLFNSLPTNDAYMRHEIFVRERPMTHIRVMANAYTYSDAVAARSTLGLPLPD